ncbi:MAG: pyruvate dehydrogenase complex dihydrolipoamide acetyltransferase [Phycisphaerales bacterium JB054]
MPIEVTMPRLSDTMEQGTVVKWYVKPGDAVSAGDLIADIETDKATMELQSFDEGTVAKIVAPEGETVAIGSLICVIAADGESVEEAAAGAAAAGGAAKQAGGTDTPATPTESATAVAEPPAQSSPAHTSNGASSQNGSGQRIFVSPLARKIAAERGLDLATIEGSGPSGRIVKKDVEGAGQGTGQAAAQTASAGQPSPASEPVLTFASGELEDRTVPLSNMRATIAKRLVESKTTIPHYQVTVSVRLDSLMALRTELNEQLADQGVKLSVNDFLVRACAVAMHQHPFINSSWVDQGPSIQLHSRVNIGVAISLPAERGGGLVVASIRDADRVGLRQISGETKRLAKKARDKGLSVEEMSGSTFTISNLGMFGVDHFTAIINPPNAAILAVGQAIEKPFVEQDEDGDSILVVGHEMSMTMSSDHRIIDGAMAAEYLQTVKGLLERPASLLV